MNQATLNFWQENYSRFELTEIYFEANNLAMFAVSVYMTSLFGYLVLAHIAGATLTRFQLSTVTTIYSGFSWFILWTIYANVSMVQVLSSVIFSTENFWVPTVFTSIFGLGWLVSLFYMYHIRRQN